MKSRNRRNKRRRIGEMWGWACYHCGCFLEYETMTLDHIIPVTYGGSNDDENLVPACESCNNGRGCRLIEEFAVS